MGFFDKLLRKNVLELRSPLSGVVVPLDRVPDQVFAGRMVGDGVAIDPSEGVVCAPCAGVVAALFSTCHALGIRTDEGVEILIHVGIDTVEMKGEGFSSAVQMGDRVVAGQELLRFDPALVRAKAPSALTPVVLTTMPLVESFRAAQGMVTAGNDVLLSVVLKPLA